MNGWMDGFAVRTGLQKNKQEKWKHEIFWGFLKISQANAFYNPTPASHCHSKSCTHLLLIFACTVVFANELKSILLWSHIVGEEFWWLHLEFPKYIFLMLVLLNYFLQLTCKVLNDLDCEIFIQICPYAFGTCLYFQDWWDGSWRINSSSSSVAT